jgi:hypothetical protein
LPPASARDAIEAAQQRTRFLSDYLNIQHPAEFPQFEIIEVPPDSPTTDRAKRELSPTDAVGQMVRLRWQHERPELLLLERVVDTAIGVVDRIVATGSRAPKGRPEILGAVSLEHRRDAKRKNDIFPWTVIVETDHPEIFRPEFERLRSWLPIEILFDRPGKIVRYGQCQSLGGRLGEVGGLLDVQSERFPMTCAHVLSDSCRSLVVASDAEGEQQPDAALIQLGQPCFDFSAQSAFSKTPATQEDFRECKREKRTVRYANTRRKDVRGFLQATVSEFPVEGILYRFPHQTVVPKTRLIFGHWPWPPGSGLFSEPGDSGSWVLIEKSQRWVGMLVAGDAFTRTSYVAEGKELLEFFELELIRRGQTINRGTTVPLALE